MTDSPFLDPNDPHYSDTPSVDEHPLEGDPLAVLATERGYIHTTPEKLRRDLRADGYLLVSEAELAEAMKPRLVRTPNPDGNGFTDAQMSPMPSDVWAALAKQQEGRNA